MISHRRIHNSNTPTRALLRAAAAATCALALPRLHADETPDHRHDDPVSLEQHIVTASPLGRDQVDLAQSTTVLAGLRLQTQATGTLGDTLASEPGINATHFGPGASRPIVRGLDGERLRLLENGSLSFDVSASSPDHAVGIEPFLVRRIEVVRGPASLMYGNAAVGGVVNVLTHRIEDEIPEKRLTGSAQVQHDSAANAWTRGAAQDTVAWKNEAGDKALVVHLDGFRRDAGDLRIPGWAESAEHRAENGEGDDEPGKGVLSGSAVHADGGAFGATWLGSDHHLGMAYSGYNTRYGVPGHSHAGHNHEEEDHEETGEEVHEEDGVTIDLRQRRVDLQGELMRVMGPFSGLRLKATRQSYTHKEIEASGEIGTQFWSTGTDLRTELLHGADGRAWAGAMGAQASEAKLRASGEEAFVPDSRTRTGALFAFEEYKRGALSVQAGARLEHQEVRSVALAQPRKDTLAGASLGAVWRLGQGWSLGANTSRTTRAPSAQELLADGPHAGTASYEIGDVTLGRERVTNAELVLRRNKGLVTGELSVFTQRFSNHLRSAPTGQVAVEGHDGWAFVDADSPEAGEGMTVRRMMQGRARYTGGELDVRVHLHPGETHALDLRLGGDLVRATADDGPLPRIPAARSMLGLEWRHARWTAAVDWTHAFAQRRVAANEETSAAYELVGATLHRCIPLGRVEVDLYLRVSNLLDREIRPHTSYLKELAPLAGRSFGTGVTVRW